MFCLFERSRLSFSRLWSWWRRWSSCRRTHLLLWRSEFESFWCLRFFCKMLLEMNEMNKKRPGLTHSKIYWLENWKNKILLFSKLSCLMRFRDYSKIIRVSHRFGSHSFFFVFLLCSFMQSRKYEKCRFPESGVPIIFPPEQI